MRATAFRNFKRGIAILAIVCMMFALMPANTFAFQASDISGHWAQVKIQSWIDKGLIKGYPDGTFKPDQDITRAEFMALVNRAFGYTAVAPITYTDVKAGSWYAPEVAKAQAAGYISGYPDGTMKPENPITREEVATIVARIKKLTSDVNAAGKYTDAAKIGSWSKGQVGAVTSAKIMQGYPDGSFMPQGLITRAEVVEALDNALHYTAPVVVTPPVVTPPVVTPPVVTPPVPTPPVVTPPVPTYAVTFTVEDATYAKIDGASVAIVSQGTIATDVYGVAIFNLADGTYAYDVTKTGYNATSGSALVNGAALGVSVTMTAITNTNVTSPAFTTTAANNTVTVTLTGGTFKAGAIAATDFTFAGTNAAALALGTFTRTSDTVVTITGLTLADGVDNTVTVLGATQAIQATSVAGEASTVALPDLTVDTLYFDPAQPTAGGLVAFYFTIRNQGSAPITTDYSFDIYVDGELAVVVGPPDTGLLASGASADWRVDMTWPIDTASHTFMVGVDPDNVIAESNESNNSASISASAAPGYAVTFTVASGVYAIDGASFTIADGVYAIDGASITIASQTIATDVYGVATINLANGTYPYAVTATGYDTVNGSAGVNSAALPVLVRMTAITNVTSRVFTTTAANNTVTVTLTDGTFKTGAIAATDFTFAGTDATALAAGTFARTSDTVVTITGLTLAGGTDNRVTVLAATQATQATSVAAVASTQ